MRSPIGVCARKISIHALLAESDGVTASGASTPRFLSTLSLRRATVLGYKDTVNALNFYPRSPCGERRRPLRKFLPSLLFLSTLSLRRATDKGAGNKT